MRDASDVLRGQIKMIDEILSLPEAIKNRTEVEAKIKEMQGGN